MKNVIVIAIVLVLIQTIYSVAGGNAEANIANATDARSAQIECTINNTCDK